MGARRVLEEKVTVLDLGRLVTHSGALRPQPHPTQAPRPPLTFSPQQVPIPDRLQQCRPTLLKLSAPSTHWLLQNPTVATVAFVHWPFTA